MSVINWSGRVADLNNVLFEFRPEVWNYKGDTLRTEFVHCIPERLDFPLLIQLTDERMRLHVWARSKPSYTLEAPGTSLSGDFVYIWDELTKLKGQGADLFRVELYLANKFLLDEEDVWVLPAQTDVASNETVDMGALIEFMVERQVSGKFEEDDVPKSGDIFFKVYGVPDTAESFLADATQIWRRFHPEDAKEWYPNFIQPHALALLTCSKGGKNVQFWNSVLEEQLRKVDWYRYKDSRYRSGNPLSKAHYLGWMRTKHVLENSDQLRPTEPETYTICAAMAMGRPKLPAEITVEMVQEKLVAFKAELEKLEAWAEAPNQIIGMLADLLRSKIKVTFMDETFTFYPKYRLKEDAFTELKFMAEPVKAEEVKATEEPPVQVQEQVSVPVPQPPPPKTNVVALTSQRKAKKPKYDLSSDED